MKTEVFKIVVMVLIITGGLTSCTEKEVMQEYCADELNAQVENASNYNNVVEVKLMMHDSNVGWELELVRSNWKDGGFAIELPKTLAANYLHPLVNNVSVSMPYIVHYTPSTLSISNENVKVGTAFFWGIDKNSNTVTHFYPFKIDENGNAQRVFFTFVASDITISGYNEIEAVIAEDSEYEFAHYLYLWQKTTTFSINWKKGWNVWCLSSFQSKEERTITEHWSTITANELKWYSGEDLWKLNIN